MPDPTPDSILAVLIDATAEIQSATEAKRLDLSHVEDELAQLPPLGFTLARTMLVDMRTRLSGDVVAATRQAVTRAAAKLSLRTGPDGECDIDKPAIRPKGPPTKAEKAARASAGDPQPAETPAPVPEAAQAFFDGLSDRAPAAELEALGWTGALADALSDVASRVVCKHRIHQLDVEWWPGDDTPVAFGKTWTMADEPRVVA